MLKAFFICSIWSRIISRRRSKFSRPRLAIFSAEKIMLRLTNLLAVKQFTAPCKFVPSAGIEPASEAPQAPILSIKLREQYYNWLETKRLHYLFRHVLLHFFLHDVMREHHCLDGRGI